MHALVRPKFFIPAHGETRMLYQHAELAHKLGVPFENIFILANGDIFEISKGSARVPGFTNGGAVLIDCGASAEVSSEFLMQFAYMGSYYAQRFLGVENPRVALLNIGAEESKGLELQKQTYALLTEAKQAGRIHFVGNIEGREAITQGVDVLVTAGYTGHIFLKTMEGAAALFSGALKEMLLASTKNMVAALMLKNSIGDFKKRFDSSEVGGTALLGISQPVVKAHGSSNAYAFYNAIRQAKTVAEADIVGDIAANVEHMRWERPKPAEKQEEG